MQHHRCVAVHFWATWNGYDRDFDTRLAPLRIEFADRVEFRSVNVDDDELAGVQISVPVLNVPALGIWRHGVRDQVVVGMRDRDALRRALAWAVRPAGVPPSEATS